VPDVDGKHFAREFARTARELGEGWVDYKWVHPVTGEIFVKRGYMKREGDLVLSCSVYRY
jgi:signal transduction histidine kinase